MTSAVLIACTSGGTARLPGDRGRAELWLHGQALRDKPCVMMELTVGIALATMGNYLDHLDPIALDPAYAAEAR